MAKKQKIPLAEEHSAMAVNPFAALNLGPLPPGPEAPPPPEKPVPEKPRKSAGRVVLRRETAHRGGKTVTVIYDLPTSLSDAEIEELAQTARRACGCGGTVRERRIELQGEQVAAARKFFESKQFQVAGER